MLIAAVPIGAKMSTGQQHDKPSKLQRRTQLPVYDTDCSCKHKVPAVATKEKSSLEMAVGQLRLTASETVGSLKGSQDRLIEIYETGKAHTLVTVAHLREESNVLSRVGAIAVGGITGLLFSVRGGFFKKLLFGSVGASAVASVCYPAQASQVSKSAFTITKYYAIVGYTKAKEELSARREVKSESSSPRQQIADKFEKLAEQKAVSPGVPREKTESSPPRSESGPSPQAADAKFKGDYGQSHPEDKDMYTTRG